MTNKQLKQLLEDVDAIKQDVRLMSWFGAVAVVVLLVLLWTGSARAADAAGPGLRDFSMEYYRIANHRDAYWPYPDATKAESGEEHWAYGFATQFNLRLLSVGPGTVYWDNRVHGEATNAQVREVGWQYEAGLDVARRVQLYYGHHSRHILDTAGATDSIRFPLDNVYGARVVFYREAP
jgi:hypothetical protein